MTFENWSSSIKTFWDFVKQRKYLFVLLLLPFFILFFITQDHGHEGKITAKDYTYQGQIRNDQPEGTGTMTFTNGNVYKGQFKSGTFDGKGSLTDKVQNWTYTGSFSAGQPNGQGQMKLSDGTTKPVKFKMGVLIK